MTKLNAETILDFQGFKNSKRIVSTEIIHRNTAFYFVLFQTSAILYSIILHCHEIDGKVRFFLLMHTYMAHKTLFSRVILEICKKLCIEHKRKPVKDVHCAPITIQWHYCQYFRHWKTCISSFWARFHS